MASVSARTFKWALPRLSRRASWQAFSLGATGGLVTPTLAADAWRRRSASCSEGAAGISAGALLWRLQSLDTCALCDASEKQARVISTVQPLKSGYQMSGRARTLQVNGDFLEVLLAIREAEPGDVLMIDASLRGGPEDAQWPKAGGMFGELLATEAARRGVTGMVIDGNCRDTPVLREMSLPVYCRGTHPNAGTANRRGAQQVEVRMGGVTVSPGDFVLGDDDGVVVCSQAELREWLPKAEAIQRVEAGILGHVRAGGSLYDMITNLDEHLQAIADGRASKLQLG